MQGVGIQSEAYKEHFRKLARVVRTDWYQKKTARVTETQGRSIKFQGENNNPQRCIFMNLI